MSTLSEPASCEFREVPYFFGPSGLFGVRYVPTTPTRTAVVVCHPFGEEKLWSQRVLVNFARTMAAHGTPVLRFDSRGQGDSPIAEQECLDTYLEDIDSAVTETLERTDFERVVLVGVRFGGTLAARIAHRDQRVSALVIWEPLLDQSRYMQELLRVNLSTQIACFGEVRDNRDALLEQMRKGNPVNVGGYYLTAELYDEMLAASLTDEGDVGIPTLLIETVRNESAKPNTKLEALADTLSASHARIVQQPFWRETPAFSSRAPALYEATRSFLEQHHAAD
jgi:alpha-beta hydrolase superfamily lysophospholipase